MNSEEIDLDFDNIEKIRRKSSNGAKSPGRYRTKVHGQNSFLIQNNKDYRIDVLKSNINFNINRSSNLRRSVHVSTRSDLFNIKSNEPQIK